MPPADCRKTVFGFMQHLRPIGLFVGNGLDRSVPPCQKHDMARKPRAIRRDFMRCARPDVRMGQDPSLQMSRKQTFFTSCIAAQRRYLILKLSTLNSVAYAKPGTNRRVRQMHTSSTVMITAQRVSSAVNFSCFKRVRPSPPW